MKEEILKQIAEYMARTSDFVLEQAPLLCQEIVAFTRAEAMMHVAFGVVLLSVAIFLVCCLYRCGRKWYDDNREGVFMGSIAAAFMCLFIGCVLTYNGAIDYAKATCAPRYLIVDKILSRSK
jgi:hypothetical protein